MNCGMALPRIGCVAVGALAACTAMAAPGWVPDGKGWLWEGKALAVRFEPPGTLRVLRQGREMGSLAFFHWHDAWVYERLERGTARSGPALDEAGILRQSGLWGTTEPAPPLEYSLSLAPAPDGIEVVLEVRKTAALKLTDGIWAVLALPQPLPAGTLLFAEPAAFAQPGQDLTGPFQRLLAGVPGETALALVPDGIGSVRSRVSQSSHVLEIALRRGDVPVGETARIRLALREAAMPAPPPDPAGPRREPLALRGARPVPASVEQYEVVDLTVDLAGTWDNPYDPADVRLDARVTSPSGTVRDVPGFFMVPHRRHVTQGVEIMLPAGYGEWHVRLCATEPGLWQCELRARDRTGEAALALPGIRVEPSRRRGFVRVSKVDPHYLVFDDGSPYVPIGHNLPIYHATGQLADEALARMAAAGENWNRWWLSSSGLGLEWEAALGRYRQAQAARIDLTMEWAAQYGFLYMMCLDTHQDFRESGWAANPFNAARGGPCKTAGEWFTSEQARALYRNRLRYIVARWGARPEVLCWEFGNEFEGWADTSQEALLAWHREMAACLRGLDPYGHPITTSFWSKTGPAAFWEIPEIDIVQTHCYTNNDANVAEQVREYCLHQWRSFAKPHLFGEFGIRSHETTADKDPRGWALHNAFWVAVASGCDGIPMPWWHENYIDPLDLYGHFRAIRRFTEGLPFGTAVWRQVEAETEYAEPRVPAPARDAVLTPLDGFRRRAVNEFTLAPDGTVNDPGELLGLLHGDGHRDLRNPPVFTATYPAPGDFAVGIERVSNHGHLQVWVDDRLALERDLPCGEGHGKSWVYRPQWQLWESVYAEEVVVQVPAGTHRIRVENTGKDWVRVKSYRFGGCRVLDRPNLLVAALAADRCAVVWVQNRDSDWYLHGRDAVTPVPASNVRLKGLPDGLATVEWWETWEGTPHRREKIAVRDGILSLHVPALRTDVAARVSWAEP